MTEATNTAAAVAKDLDAGETGEETQTKAAREESDEPVPAKATIQAAAERAPTLREVFAVPEKATDRGDDRWQSFQTKLAEEAKGIKWTAAMPDLGAKICELLDIKLHDILLAAWKKVEALRQVLNDSKKTPDKSVYLDLAEHSIDYATKPFVDVKIKSASIKKITLHVALNLKLKGFILKVQNGAIREIQTGSCEVKGAIKYEKMTIAEKKVAPIKFPFSIRVPSLIVIDETAGEAESMAVSETPVRTAAAAKLDGESSLAEGAKTQAPVERIEL